MKILIVGGVAGGATAATRLRRLSEDDQIIIFERSGYVSFANCGLPYFLGGVIKERERLLQETPETLNAKFNIDVRIYSEVKSIDSISKKIHVLNLKTNEEYDESFDKLIISTGAAARSFPFEGGENAKNLFTLRNIEDVDKITEALTKEPKTALVVGGGFIGIECAENLVNRGLKVTLVESKSQILNILDSEIVALVQNEMMGKGIKIFLNTSIEKFEDNGSSLILSNKTKYNFDLILLAMGVVPENSLAKSANLDLSKDGYILTNNKMQTFINNKVNNDIFAIGDVITTKDLIDDSSSHIALAGPANRQARLVADVINNLPYTYKGVLGTSVLKIFSLTASAVGYTESLCEKKNMPHQSVIIERNQHAGYYPGASLVTFKLVFDPTNGKILGAQAVGYEGVEKRIDVVSTAISGKLTVYDLVDLELSYAPPYGTAKDIINIAGYAATNLLQKQFKQVSLKDFETEKKDAIIIDSRTSMEFQLDHFENAINIPFVTIRKNLEKLPKDKNSKIIVYCNVGMTAYMWIRVALNLGYTNLYNLEGGMRLYKLMHLHDDEVENDNKATPMDNPKEVKPMEQMNENMKEVDCTGLQCPGPIMAASTAINSINDGEKMRVIASDVGFASDVMLWCKTTGNTLVSNETKDGKVVAVIQKGKSVILNDKPKGNGGTTIVLFSGDMDKALASLIIAQGTRAMNKPATVFCTFWGLNLLRKPKSPHVKKSLLEKMFGFMMPKGAKKFKLSKMNMAGMGSKMMKHVMKKKNVPLLEEQLENAKKAGVRFLACTMSMDIMGIKKEELIDGIEYVGVATYLAECQEASTTLFI